MGDFRKLRVWEKAKDLSVEIYRLTFNDLFSRDFRFRDQIRSAAVSVPSNIAEGDKIGNLVLWYCGFMVHNKLKDIGRF